MSKKLLLQTRLNLSDVTMFRAVSMFVIRNMNTFHAEYVGMIQVNLYAEFYILISNIH
jgi:hypothetical protein